MRAALEPPSSDSTTPTATSSMIDGSSLSTLSIVALSTEARSSSRNALLRDPRSARHIAVRNEDKITTSLRALASMEMIPLDGNMAGEVDLFGTLTEILRYSKFVSWQAADYILSTVRKYAQSVESLLYEISTVVSRATFFRGCSTARFREHDECQQPQMPY